MGVFSELPGELVEMGGFCARNLVAGWPGIRGLRAANLVRALWRITVGIARRSRTIRVNGGLLIPGVL